MAVPSLPNTVETELLIETLLRRTMVEIARLATAGGARLPLARLQDQVFLELTRELSRQGVTTKVVADMLGVAPRTYHRRVHETQRSVAARPRSVWQQVLELLRGTESISAHALKEQFMRESADLISAVLHDLVHSGLARRDGWGDSAVYRATPKGEQLLLTLELVRCPQATIAFGSVSGGANGLLGSTSHPRSG